MLSHNNSVEMFIPKQYLIYQVYKFDWACTRSNSFVHTSQNISITDHHNRLQRCPAKRYDGTVFQAAVIGSITTSTDKSKVGDLDLQSTANKTGARGEVTVNNANLCQVFHTWRYLRRHVDQTAVAVPNTRYRDAIFVLGQVWPMLKLCVCTCRLYDLQNIAIHQSPKWTSCIIVTTTRLERQVQARIQKLSVGMTEVWSKDLSRV